MRYAWTVEGEIETGSVHGYVDTHWHCSINDLSIGEPLRLTINSDGDISLEPADFQVTQEEWDTDDVAVRTITIDGVANSYPVDGRM